MVYRPMDRYQEKPEGPEGDDYQECDECGDWTEDWEQVDDDLLCASCAVARLEPDPEQYDPFRGSDV